MKFKKVYRILTCAFTGLMLCTTLAACVNQPETEPVQEPEQSAEYFETAKDASGKTIMLADHAKSEYSLVVPADADAYETFAAQELQTFLRESTGASLPIIADTGLTYDNTKSYISVGDTVLNKLNLDEEELGAGGGIVDVDGRLVSLAGAKGYGTVNAAYRFMHYQIGWEAYASSEVYYETKESVALLDFQDYKYIPFSDYRNILYKNIFGVSNIAAATRMGFVASSWDGGKTFDGNLFGGWLHNLKELVPVSDSAVGSDWFANGNLCLSRDEIIDYVTERVKEEILITPKAEYFMLGNDDNQGVCECDSCKEALKTCGTNGGISVRFMNKIVENLQNDGFFEANPQVNADMEFMFLNYHAYAEAPVDKEGNILVEADEHVGAFICPIDACYGHALDDPDCEKNRSELANMQNWAKVTDTIGVYLYWCNYKDSFCYYNNWAAFQTWARFFKEIDADYFYAQAIFNEYSPLGDLRQYLLSKFFTDPDCADFDTLTRDFMKHYYKGAEKEMYAYFQAIRQHVSVMQYRSGSSCVGCYDDGDVSYSDEQWWTVTVIDKLLGLLDDAYKALDSSAYTEEDKAEYTKRILIEEATLRYYRYKYHPTIFTDSAMLEEKEFLREAFDLLGCDMESEYGEIIL